MDTQPNLPQQNESIQKNSFFARHKTCWVCLLLIFIIGCLIAVSVIFYSKKVESSSIDFWQSI